MTGTDQVNELNRRVSLLEYRAETFTNTVKELRDLMKEQEKHFKSFVRMMAKQEEQRDTLARHRLEIDGFYERFGRLESKVNKIQNAVTGGGVDLDWLKKAGWLVAGALIMWTVNQALQSPANAAAVVMDTRQGQAVVVRAPVPTGGK